MGDQTDKDQPGDETGFQALFVAFFPKVQVMLMRQGADKDTAEEIAQDTMLTVWRKAGLLSKERGSLSAWIYAIARNLRIDRLRKDAVSRRCYAELEAIEIQQARAISALDDQRERNEIEHALKGLPKLQLEVIRLSFIDGLSQREIAAKLNLPIGTVKSRMRLAFEKLRSMGER